MRNDLPADIGAASTVRAVENKLDVQGTGIQHTNTTTTTIGVASRNQDLVKPFYYYYYQIRLHHNAAAN